MNTGRKFYDINLLLLIFSLLYFCILFTGSPAFYYFPLENTWRSEPIPGAISMAWYGVVIISFGLTAIVWLFLTRVLKTKPNPPAIVNRFLSILAMLSVSGLIVYIVFKELYRWQVL